ncbi:MAG: SpoIID/LytB domain-containing protein [Candidatus Obscuribacterales bacterium]|nr:SpoIID/LytB domain-containing protein [Candidatus Obscuribacterales bacterium]
MRILVGIKGPGRKDRFHNHCLVETNTTATLEFGHGQSLNLPAGTKLECKARNNSLLITLPQLKAVQNYSRAILRNHDGNLRLQIFATNSSQPAHQATYKGDLIIAAHNNHVSICLETDLESYVRGVLRSEIPASYKLEAMKAQAVLARTYALRPRIDHASEGYQVCDSFLCCQAFNGIDPSLSSDQKQAILQTQGLVLAYDGKPALALFSACAGGHTEDYANCFSDLGTNQFPGQNIPYLKGIAEGKLPAGFPNEKAMRALFNETHPDTIDAWSTNFRWQLSLTADQMEAHMHHEIEKLTEDSQFAPFIKAPPSGNFGEIKSFHIDKRGRAGTAMVLTIETSSGDWVIEKELTIRSIFANPEAKLKRLRSARIFFDQKYDQNGHFYHLIIYGFGFGHGVGLQQNGAQALALKGLSYQQILLRYYPGTSLITL